MNNSLLLLAACSFLAICVCGSNVSLRLLARARRSDDNVKQLWWFLSTLVASTTIWALHYLTVNITFTAVESNPGTGFLISSLFAIASIVLCGYGMAIYGGKSWLVEIGGGIVGSGIAGVHLWTQTHLTSLPATNDGLVTMAMGIFLAILLGMTATNRIARPVTRFCRHGGAFAFAAAIFSCYVIGNIQVLSGLSTVTVYLELMANTIGITGVACGIIFAGMATLKIDQRVSQSENLKMRHFSMTDTTTGFANRIGFEMNLSKTLANRSDDTAQTIVASVEIRQLKSINSAHGLAAGDHVLNILANRLQKIVQKNGFVGRHTGNRFILYRANLYHKNEINRLAERLLQQLAAPVAWQDVEIIVDASIGYAVHPEHGNNASDLVAHADAAADRTTSIGTNSVSRYDATEDEANRSRNALAIDLRKAISRSELELHYQPQNDVATRRLIGFEALMRWNHPQQGLISPLIFIPLAEQSGQISGLGDWALEQACIEASRWPVPLKVAVNVATQQLMDVSFTRKVQDALNDSGLTAERLELEITESGLIEDQSRALLAIKQLKNLGVKVAMDDYGTGYSSLATLRTFPFDKIKIDREFITNVETDAQAAAIVRATITLGSSLNIPVLAEGVETEENLAFLKQEGCNDVQGYLFGKPMPAAEALAMINQFSDTEFDFAA